MANRMAGSGWIAALVLLLAGCGGADSTIPTTELALDTPTDFSIPGGASLFFRTTPSGSGSAVDLSALATDMSFEVFSDDSFQTSMFLVDDNPDPGNEYSCVVTTAGVSYFTKVTEEDQEDGSFTIEFYSICD